MGRIRKGKDSRRCEWSGAMAESGQKPGPVPVLSEPRPPPAPQPDSESPDTQASLSSAPGVHFHKSSAPHPVLSGNGDTVVTTTTQVLPSQDSQSRWGDRPTPRL